MGAVMGHLASAGVTALLDLALDKLIKMIPDDVARRYGCLSVAGPLDYQKLIVAASGFLPGPTLLAVKRSLSKNDFLLTADFAGKQR